MALPLDIASACAPSTFSLPQVPGIEILSVAAAIVENFTMEANEFFRYTHPSITAENITFCNTTVTYTHSKTDDQVNVEVWLPATDWNERLYAAGGSGLGAGRFLVPYTTMAGALAEGYATVSSDAGLGYAEEVLNATWVLKSPGNLNLQLLQNFGATSMNEAVRLQRCFWANGGPC